MRIIRLHTVHLDNKMLEAFALTRPAQVGFYLLVSFLYTGHSFDNVHFLEVYERKQNFLEFDKWCVLRLADIFMYNLLALAGIAIAALVSRSWS